MTAKVFGLTKTTGNVEGEAIRYEMTETGTFKAVSTDLDYSAWEALTDDERTALCSDVRSGGFAGFFRKEGAQS